MPWVYENDDPFAGIYEKLNRAEQSILNLDDEIKDFLKNGQYPVIPSPDEEMWQEAVNYHRSQVIPLRFSVLAGEIIHHFRSVLDHIVWHFSSEEARLKHSGAIEFPVFENRPIAQNQIARFSRKIQGVT